MFRFTKVSARRKQCSRHKPWRLVIERLEDRSMMAANLVVNGDFSLGDIGFVSDYYREYLNGQAVVGSAQTYAIVNSPADARPDRLGADVRDRTSGDGLLMAVNESRNPNTLVWGQLVAIEPNTNYRFSGYVASWVATAPSSLDVRFNDMSVGTMVAPSTTGVWAEFTANWFSGTNTAVNLELRNLTTADIGGDFAIDDIYFGKVDIFPTATIGPGNIQTIAADGASNLMAVDLTRPLTLPAGSYQASKFNYEFDDFGLLTQGTITPVVLTGSGTQFTPIAIGNSVVYTEPTEGFVSAEFGGISEFTLETETIAYAGLFWDGLAMADGPELRMPVGYAGTGNSFVIYGGGTGEGAKPPEIEVPISGTGQGFFSRTYDFGIEVTSIPQSSPASLAGMVYEDLNGDGQQNFGEVGIAGVQIILTGSDDLGQEVSLRQLTNDEGAYTFGRLRPGSYFVREVQPSGFEQGRQSLGSWSGIPVGNISGVDEFFAAFGEDDYPTIGTSGIGYNFGERPQPTGAVQAGQTAGIGFWNNKQGQTLIKQLNGGTGTQLGDWLAATLPRLFGTHAGMNDLSGKNNSYVASLYQDYFEAKGQKLEAQILATALSVYSTSTRLDPSGIAGAYGFSISPYGTGFATFNIGTNGDAFGTLDNTSMTVIDLLLATDSQSGNGLLYNGDLVKKKKANSVFGSVNQIGGI